MKKFALIALLALTSLSQNSAFADQKVLLTCVAAPTTSYNDILKSITIYESDLKGRYEVSITRASGVTVGSGINESDFNFSSTSNSIAILPVAAGQEKILKQTGAYTNFEVLSLERKNGSYFLNQARTCDPYYQEEEGCIDSEQPLLESVLELDCQ
jgi:hypothetical protein